MLGQLRPWVSEKLLFPIGRVLGKTGIHPNTITAMSIPIALIAAFFLSQQNYLYAITFVFLSIFIDNLDGAVAKTMKKTSLFGSYFDVMCDKYVELILYVGLAFTFPFEALLAGFGTMLASYAKPSLALRMKIDNHDWPAIGERVDRLLILIIGLSTTIFYPILFEYNVVQTTLVLIAVITNIGAIQRVLYAKKLIESK